MARFELRLPDELMVRLEERRASFGLTKAELVRRALEEFLSVERASAVVAPTERVERDPQEIVERLSARTDGFRAYTRRQRER